MDSDLLDRLTDYLTTAVTATGRFRVVPRDQLSARLKAEKRRSYKACYQRSCQIEIGKELAAQKSLATTVIKLGSTCAVMGTLYDLLSATTEVAASIRGACGEDAVVASLEKMVSRLAGQPGSQPTTMASISAARPVLSVATPVEKVADPQGEIKPAPAAAVEAPSDLPRHTPTVVSRAPLPQYYDFMTRTEWVTVEALGGALFNSGGVGGAALSALTFKWRRFYFSALEGLVLNGRQSFGTIGARFGYPFYVGARGQKQLRLSLGIGWTIAKINNPVAISPAVQFVYLSRHFSWGIGLRAIGFVDSLRAEGDYSVDAPAAVLVSFSAGL